MADVRVTCILKAHPQGTHEHITYIGGLAGGGWRLTVEQAIQHIEQQIDTFYVLDPKTNKRSTVGVIHPTQGRPYLRTHADGVWNDNLLALGSCA